MTFVFKSASKKILFIFAICLFLPSFLCADLSDDVNTVLARKSQKKAVYSIKIVNADTGKVVFAYNADRAMIPASNMKVVTTAAALKYLGSDFEYTTTVGIQDGNLIIIGSGDPLLGDKPTDKKYSRPDNWLFEDIFNILKKNSITSVKDIIVDTGVFDDELTCPNWPADQLNRWYACETSGLNYNGNCIDMTVKNVSGNIQINIEPETAFLKIVNKVKPINKGKGAVGAYRNSEPNKLIVKGKCRKQQGPFKVAIERPAGFFAFLLHEYITPKGIAVKGKFIEAKNVRGAGFKELAVYKTAIADCIARSNKNSFGLSAECLLKTIAIKSAGEKHGSRKSGAKLVSKYLLELGVDSSQFFIDDGSGLSRQNLLSANTITTILYDVHNNSDRQLFCDSLAVCGIDGTMSKYFKEDKYRGKILGKSGYIGGVRCFSGFCNTDSGTFIFSILSNNSNYKSRAAINDIVRKLVDNYSKPAKK